MLARAVNARVVGPRVVDPPVANPRVKELPRNPRHHHEHTFPPTLDPSKTTSSLASGQGANLVVLAEGANDVAFDQLCNDLVGNVGGGHVRDKGGGQAKGDRGNVEGAMN